MHLTLQQHLQTQSATVTHYRKQQLWLSDMRICVHVLHTMHLECHHTSFPPSTCCALCYDVLVAALQPPAAARQKDKFVPLSQPQQAAAAAAAAAADADAELRDGASSSSGQAAPWTNYAPSRGLTYAQRGGGVDAEAYSRCVEMEDALEKDTCLDSHLRGVGGVALHRQLQRMAGER
jgi:hypothetical protein